MLEVCIHGDDRVRPLAGMTESGDQRGLMPRIRRKRHVADHARVFDGTGAQQIEGLVTGTIVDDEHADVAGRGDSAAKGERPIDELGDARAFIECRRNDQQSGHRGLHARFTAMTYRMSPRLR